MYLRTRSSLLAAFAAVSVTAAATAQSSVDPLENVPLDEALLAQARDMDASLETGAASFEGTLELRNLLTEPLVQTDEDGKIWVRARDLRASLGEDLTVYPVFGPESPREWPIAFEVESVTRGGQPLATEAQGLPTRQPGRLELQRAGLREVYHLAGDTIEQTFVFDTLSGEGDLVVRMAVETDLTVDVSGNELTFLHETLGGVRYGDAFVVDGAGARQAISREWIDGGIELRVPAAFLADAVLPVTIDPPINGFTSGFGIADDRQPDVIWAGWSNKFLVCWQEYTSSSNADVYLTTFNGSGSTQGTTIAIEQGDQDWRYPRIAYAYGPDRAMVVANVDLGSGNCRVRARFVDAQAMSLVGNAVTISTEGMNKGGVDVGGTPNAGLTNSYFTVVWSQVNGVADSRVRYRTIDWDGSYVTPITSLNNFADAGTQSTISNSLGDLTAGPDYWTVAWVEDTNWDGRGKIWAQRIRWDGNKDAGGGAFLVDNSPSCSSPSASSCLDDALELNGERPSIVAYDKRFVYGGHPSGYQHSVFAKVVTFGQAHALVSINSVLEDFDMNLDQYRPSVAADGKGFTLCYAEENWNSVGSGNYDMYMVSGNISERPGVANLALAERHKVLASTGFAERQGRACTMAEGEASPSNDDGAIIWVRETSASLSGYGLIAGSVFDHGTAAGTTSKAVGVQYCDAYPNSVGSYGNRNSSWLSVVGNGSVLSSHTAKAVDLPAYKLGMMIVGFQSGSINFPGGSLGRLCIGGPVGRYPNQIMNSGATGQMDFTITPWSIPSPTGPVAAMPGQSLYFQVWHRDFDNGVSSSNFTNGCRVVFQP